MPKIVIREIDKTSAGGAAYANFAVVIPGFVKAATAAVAATATTPAIPAWEPNLGVFDDNEIYGFSLTPGNNEIKFTPSESVKIYTLIIKAYGN